MTDRQPFTVELNGVLQRLRIKGVRTKHLPAGVKRNHRCTKEQLAGHVRTICANLGTTFDETKFNAAYLEAEKVQREGDNEKFGWIARYEEYEKAPPSTIGTLDKPLMDAFKAFLATRTEVIGTLNATDKASTIIAYADAGANAERLGAYLGGVRVTKIDKARLGLKDGKIGDQYTTVILYGHVERAWTSQGTHSPVLGHEVKLTPAEVGAFLGQRHTVAVLGCTSDEFTTALKLAMSVTGKFVETTQPFEWLVEVGSRMPYVRAIDFATNATIGTLITILK